MTFKEHTEAMYGISEAYSADSCDGPSMNWLKQYSQSGRCTSLERRLCEQLLADRRASWFAVARLVSTVPVVLTCKYSAMRRICDWFAARQDAAHGADFTPSGTVLVKTEVPTGGYSVFMSAYQQKMYWFSTWRDDENVEWGITSGEVPQSGFMMSPDTRVTIRSLVKSHGVAANAFMITAYASIHGLFSWERPAAIDVTGDECSPV